MSQRALAILSGGQDSTTCLFWALKRFGTNHVEALTFDYDQRHRIELHSARAVAALVNVPHTILPINTFAAIGGNALTDPGIAPSSSDTPSALPNTFVPGRNLIFLTFAGAFAYQRGITHLVAGMAQTDYSGYPDCRENTLETLMQAINLGMETEFTLHTPLMHATKKETVLLAQNLGALKSMALTHTCYEGLRPPCGTCPACRLRAKGFTEAGISDPLLDSPIPQIIQPIS